MQTHTINANLQLIPLGQDKHPYEWVDEVIDLIAKSGISYSVGPFGTSLEGTYEAITQLIHQINEHLLSAGCPEWLLNVQWQIRNGADVTVEEKVGKHNLQANSK